MDRPNQELIYDRTITDVRNNTNKGNYNASDLNRIESWCKYLSEVLNDNGYYTNIETYTDWEIGLGKENMTSHINRIKTNLETLKEKFYTLKSTPTTDTSKTSINYIDANDMEKILFDIDYLIVKLQENFKYSNTFYSGTDLYLPFNTIL